MRFFGKGQKNGGKKAKSLKIWGKCIKFENVLKKWQVIGYDNLLEKTLVLILCEMISLTPSTPAHSRILQLFHLASCS